MAKIPGLNISAPVVPIQDTDTYPSHYSKYGNGGWQEVVTIADRDAISAPRRVSGMAVYVIANHKLYTLDDNLTTWTEFKAGSTDSIRKTDTFGGFDPLYNNEIVEFIGTTDQNYTNGYFYKAVAQETTPVTYVWTQVNVQPITEVYNGTDYAGQDPSVALSALSGVTLQEEIEALSGRGRFLSVWNCITGLADTDPTVSPYEYKAGDYYIVGHVVKAEPESCTIRCTYGQPEFSVYWRDPEEEYKQRFINEQGYTADAKYYIVNTKGSPVASKTGSASGDTSNVSVDTNRYASSYIKLIEATELCSQQSDYQSFEYIGFTIRDNGYDTPAQVNVYGYYRNTSDSVVSVSITTFRSSSLDPVDQIQEVIDYLQNEWYILVTGDLVIGHPWGSSTSYKLWKDLTTYERNFISDDYAYRGLRIPFDSDFVYDTQYEGDYIFEVDYRTLKQNFRPNGSSYTIGVPSETVETLEVGVDDSYIYDGLVWHLLSNGKKEITFTEIAGSPYDNEELANALDAKQDTLTAGTNITIEEDAQTGDLVISSVAQESFYRGRFNNWNSVPVNESGYLPEPGTQDLKTPTNNDFIVIIDPSDYASPEFTENFTFTGFQDPELGYGVSWTYLNVTYKVYGNSVVFGPGDCLRLEVPTGGLTALRTTMVDGTPLYPNSGIIWLTGGQHSASTTGSPGDYTGTWRFYYNGNWATDGKLGWLPQYQIENTLPIASPTEQGITKLYNTTGTNTDGAVDQNTVTNELGKRVLQVTEFPEASASNEGQLVQFIGTGGSGTTGWFYTSTQYQIPYSLTVEGDSDVTVTTYDTETYLSQLSDTTVDSTTVFTYDGTDWKDSDSNVVDLTDWGITISGTPVNNSTITGTYVAPSTGYKWVQTDTQPTEEYHESFFRGPFYNWSVVPDVGHEDQYYADFYGNHRPGLTDYIVITDPLDYVSEETEIIHLFTHSIGGHDASIDVTITSTGEFINYLFTNVYGVWTKISNTDFYITYARPETGGGWGIKNDSTPFAIDGVVYPVGSIYYWGYTTRVDKSVNGYHVYRGMWRFSYASNSWDSEGKNGWKPEYQIENVLPIADSQTLGIAKLYTTTGTHTDGSVTQKLVTDELNKKQNTLTEGTGISIDENNVISATFSESYFRGKFSTWNTVPTDYRSYYPDYTGSTKPTRTDYMVVEDPSSYIKPGAPIEIYQLPLVGGTAYIKIVMNGQEYTFNHNDVTQNPKTFGIEGHRLYLTYNTPNWYITPLDIPVIVDGVEKPINEVAYSWDYNRGSSEYLQKTINFIGQSGYEGTWRFSYQSDDWDTSGKNGWEPEYQIEDVLPIATDTDAGIMKLYTTTGNNTDGTMDQSSITIELGNKQDTLTNASNAGEGIIIDDVTQEISTNNIVWRKW